MRSEIVLVQQQQAVPNSEPEQQFRRQTVEDSQLSNFGKVLNGSSDAQPLFSANNHVNTIPNINSTSAVDRNAIAGSSSANALNRANTSSNNSGFITSNCAFQEFSNPQPQALTSICSPLGECNPQNLQ